MIRIEKAPKPQILADNEEQWTKDLLAAIARRDANKTPIPDSVRFRYRHEDVKLVLVAESHGKCGYCESQIRHTQHGDAEHIVPFVRDPRLTFDWLNLVLGCRLCNHLKHTHPQDQEPIVDPTRDSPSQHVLFVGPLLFARPGDTKGHLTIGVLDLNRTELVERRRDKLQDIQPLVHQWANAPVGSVQKSLLETQLVRLADSNQEYAYMVSCLLRHQCNLDSPHAPG